MDPNVRPVGRPRTRELPERYDAPEAVAARRRYMAEYKRVNAEHLKAYYKQWRLDHKPQMLEANRAYHARARAKRLAAEAQAREGVVAPLTDTDISAVVD